VERRAARTVALTLTGHTESVTAVAFAPDEKWIMTGSADTTLRRWDARSGSSTVIAKADGPIRALAISPDGGLVAVAAGDAVSLHDASSGARSARLAGHDDPVNALAFTPDGAVLLTASDDGAIIAWGARDGARLATMRFVRGENAAYVFTATAVEPFGAAARALPVCRVGPMTLPFEVCEKRFATPNLLERALARDPTLDEP
jgi:WD40 repeat protein